MPSKRFALEKDGPERLDVSWSAGFKDVSLALDGSTLAEFVSADEIRTTRTTPLPDGSRLEVVLDKYGPFPELRISRDGVPLPGSPTDPHFQLAQASMVLFLVAGFNAVVGAVAVLIDNDFLKGNGIGWPSIWAGIVYAVLAVLVKRGSVLALGVAVTLFVLDGLYTFVLAANAKLAPPIGSVVMRFFLLMPMIRAFSAIQDLKKPPRPKPRPALGQTRARSVTSGDGAPAAAPVLSKATPAPAPAPAAPAARTFTGEAEKRRLTMPEKTTTSVPTVTGKKVDVKGPAGIDSARKALRFIAHKVEIRPESLVATMPNGEIRDVSYADVARIVTRQLPPDPPWDGAFFIDIVPHPDASGGRDPVRIFPTTTVNYAAVPGGSSPSRLDNTRRLTAFLRDKCPAAAIDDATAEFIRGPKVPLRFVNMTQFLEYDTAYD
jgi:hypothetical protein